MTTGSSMHWVTLAFLSWPHILLILVVLLLLFGGQKLPELAKGVAKGLRIFKDELHGINKSIEDPPPTEKKDDQLADKK